LSEVGDVAESLLAQTPTLAVIGPFDGPDRFRS
jgi:hypothetical protein